MTAESGETPKAVVTGGSFFESLKSIEKLEPAAEFWLEIIEEETPEADWDAFAGGELTVEAFEILAEAVQGTIAADLQHWSDQEFYDSQREIGRDLLRKLYEKGIEAGLVLDTKDAERPLSVLEVMVARGMVEEVIVPADRPEAEPV